MDECVLEVFPRQHFPKVDDGVLQHTTAGGIVTETRSLVIMDMCGFPGLPQTREGGREGERGGGREGRREGGEEGWKEGREGGISEGSLTASFPSLTQSHLVSKSRRYCL